MSVGGPVPIDSRAPASVTRSIAEKRYPAPFSLSLTQCLKVATIPMIPTITAATAAKKVQRA
jgi:hypothetical protein